MTTITSIRKSDNGKWSLRLGALLVGSLLVGSCGDLDIVGTNAPTVETLTESPTREKLATAATGIFSQAFNSVATEIQFYALYGREGYNLAGNDPRETDEQIRGPQDPTGRNSGNWLAIYSAIRTINTYLAALPNATGLVEDEVRASAGFAKTLMAWHIHRLAVRTGELGIPIDVDRPITAEPAPFVTFATAMEAASNLLDEALSDLEAGSAAFPFTMAPGYTGFETPETFKRFNRALAAKVLVHRATFVGCDGCWAQAAAALEESFVTTAGLPESLTLGVNYHYSAAPGEPSNPISEPLTNDRFWVHPSIVDGVQLRGDGTPDLRFTRKVMDSGRSLTLRDLTGTHKPVLYNSRTNPAEADLGAPIPWINNEELLLLRAEARWHTNNKQGAIDDLNLVRTHSGGLDPAALTPASSDDEFIDELLYNRLYSLMWSQGTRWIDARRYKRLESLPIDRPGDSLFQQMAIPADECSARGLSVPCAPLSS